MEKKENIIVEKSYKFALKIIEYCELLEEERKYVIARQLLKSGTSIGANIRESQNAESKYDFIHKLKISLKETEEAKYWLLLCEGSKNYPKHSGLLNDLREIKLILSKIVFTSRQNQIHEPQQDYIKIEK